MQDRRRADAILDLPFTGLEQDAALRKIVDFEDECFKAFHGEIRFLPQAIVGGMAEQMVLTTLASIDEAPLAGMSDERLEATGFGPRNSMEDIALCLVRQDPKPVRAMIRTTIGSSAEAALLDQIIAHLGKCLPAGKTVTLKRSMIRWLVEPGLYRGLQAISAQAQVAGTAPQ